MTSDQHQDSYDQVRNPDHSTLGDAAIRRARDADAFEAGVQYGLDRLLAATHQMPYTNWLPATAASILRDAREGTL